MAVALHVAQESTVPEWLRIIVILPHSSAPWGCHQPSLRRRFAEKWRVNTGTVHTRSIGRNVENQIGCGCRHIFLEFQEWLNAQGQHGLRN